MIKGLMGLVEKFLFRIDLNSLRVQALEHKLRVEQFRTALARFKAKHRNERDEYIQIFEHLDQMLVTLQSQQDVINAKYLVLKARYNLMA